MSETPPTVAWPSPEPLAGPAPGVEFAPHGVRLVAYLLDGIIISIVVVITVIGGADLVAGGRVIAVDAGAIAARFVLVVLASMFALLYFPFFWARGGQTLGMRPFGLRVVRDRDGGRIGWGTALMRLLGLWVAVNLYFIGVIWIFFDKRHRGWQDLIGGTVMVKER